MAIPANWNSKLTDVINYIKINGDQLPQMHSDYRVDNSIVYAEEPTRLSTFAVNNTEIDYAYVPNISFTFNYMPIVLFQWLLEQLNQDEFTVEYYDYTTNTVANRTCYMSQKDIQSIYNKGKDIQAITGFTVTFVSRYGYATYADLKTNTPIPDEV